MAQESLRRHGRDLHRLHRLHARDAVPPAVLPAARRDRRRRDRAVVRPEPGRDAGRHGADVAALGAARRPRRPQDHDRAIARELRHRHGGDGVRDRGLARLRAARDTGALRRLRRAGADDGRRRRAKRSDGVRDRHRADRAADRTRARTGDRRDGRADRRSQTGVSGDGGVLSGGARARVHDVSRASRPRPQRRKATKGASRFATSSRSRTSSCSSRSCSVCSSSIAASGPCSRSTSRSWAHRCRRFRFCRASCFRSRPEPARSAITSRGAAGARIDTRRDRRVGRGCGGRVPRSTSLPPGRACS